MGFGHVGSVASILNYEEAHKFFCSKPAHTRCKGWQSDERCLKDRASGNRHYRITQYNGGEFYDVCLYQTVMARFYRPNADGQRRVLYAGHNSTTSQSFMWKVLQVWRNHSRTTTDGRTVVVPVYNRNTIEDRADKFSADLTFDRDMNLIVDKSKHTPHYVYRSNAEDKAKRQRIKEKFSNYTMLAQLRMPEFAENCTPTRDDGRPFGGANVSYNERMAVESMLEMDADDLARENQWVDHFFAMCQGIYDTLVAKRGYNQDKPFILAYRWTPVGAAQASTPADLEKPVTEKDLEKAILTKVYKLVGAHGGTQAVEQPQFMDKDSYPRSSITAHA